MRKVDLYAKAQDGTWTLIFKDIDEDKATEIWKAGFHTGENRFSIETEEDRRIREMNMRTLGRA